MRILFVTNNFTPYSGGVVNSITTTTQALQKAGHDVRIITLDFLGKRHQDLDYVIRVSCPIKFMYKTNHMAIPWRSYAHIYNFCTQWQPEIIHVHHPFLLGKNALEVAKQLHIPVVFTYHTIYEAYAHYIPFFNSITRRITKKVVNTFCNEVDGILVPAKPIMDDLIQRQITSPLTVIPSSIDDQFFQKKPEPKKKKDPFQLLVVSRFAQEKNIPFLLDLMQDLPSYISLTLVGYGSEYEFLQYYAYQQLGLSPERVQFIYKPSKEDLLTLYQSADLFVFSSKTDTQGLVLAEAMACGTPVIALNGPGQCDSVKNNYNGFLVETREEMREKILHIFQDDNLHLHLQQGAWQTAQKYQSKFIVEKMLNFYGTVKGYK